MTVKELKKKYRQTNYRKTIRAHKKQCRIRAERQAKDKGKWMSIDPIALTGVPYIDKDGSKKVARMGEKELGQVRQFVNQLMS